MGSLSLKILDTGWVDSGRRPHHLGPALRPALEVGQSLTLSLAHPTRACRWGQRVWGWMGCGQKPGSFSYCSALSRNQWSDLSPPRTERSTERSPSLVVSYCPPCRPPEWKTTAFPTMASPLTLSPLRRKQQRMHMATNVWRAGDLGALEMGGILRRPLVYSQVTCAGLLSRTAQRNQETHRYSFPAEGCPHWEWETKTQKGSTAAAQGFHVPSLGHHI